MGVLNIINIVETVKQIHKTDVIIVQIGKFYQVYGKDAYIISFIFGYKIQNVQGTKMCGFPVTSIKKVMARLEEKKINYLILDRRNNYEVEERVDNKNLNNYKAMYEKANKYINYKVRIDNIYNYLLKNIEKEEFKNIIGRMEAVAYERGEV